MVLCSSCPRSYHHECLDKEFKVALRGKIQFHCPQHQCVDCQQKTSDAGGMIYRCRWCERGYCEDCLDFDKTKLLGENLKEYELLGFPAVTQAFYISCPACHDHFEEDEKARTFCREMALIIDEQHSKMLKENALTISADEETKKGLLSLSRAESLTDATTLDVSGATTPQTICTYGKTMSERKAKSTLRAPKLTPRRLMKGFAS